MGFTLKKNQGYLPFQETPMSPIKMKMFPPFRMLETSVPPRLTYSFSVFQLPEDSQGCGIAEGILGLA